MIEEFEKRIDEYINLKNQYEEYREKHPILDEASKYTMLDYIAKQNDFIIRLLSFYIVKGEELNEFNKQKSKNRL